MERADKVISTEPLAPLMGDLRALSAATPSGSIHRDRSHSRLHRHLEKLSQETTDLECVADSPHLQSLEIPGRAKNDG
jgi:hypothetical protein